MERYSENPSGRVKGLGKVSFILFLVVVIGGYYLMYKDDFSKFTEEFKSLFEPNYTINYDDPIDDYEEDFFKSFLQEYGIREKSKTLVLSPMSYYQGSIYVNNKRYDVKYNRTSKFFELRDYLDYSNYVDYNNTDTSEWQTMKIEKVNNTILISIDTLDNNIYLLVDCTSKLVPALAFQTTPEYAPVLATDNKFYFAEVKADGNYVYSYDTRTHRTTIEVRPN